MLFNSPLQKFTDDIYNDPLFNPKLFTNEDVEQEEKEAENVEQEQYFKEKASEELENINEQSIEDYVQDAIENELINDEINEEVYGNSLFKENEDFIDNGYNYGDQEQGIDNDDDEVNKYNTNEILEPFNEDAIE